MTDLFVAGLAFAGTAVGTLGGIVASSRLTNHRLEQLERKVDKHNHLVERMVVVEQGVKSAQRRLDSMEEKGE